MGKLFAGASIRCITPSAEMLSMINSDGRYGYTGIGDEIYCRVTILGDIKEKFLIIASDLSRYPLPVEFLNQIKEKFDIDEDHLMVGGTRSHSTVSYTESAKYADFAPGAGQFYRFVHEKTVEAIQEAIARMVPARIGGVVAESGINAGRESVTPIGTLEASVHGKQEFQSLRVVKIEDLTGKIISVIVNYSMHCVSQAWNDMSGEWKKISGDVGGAVSQYIERWGKHEFPCSWTVGGGSDRIPLFMANLERCNVDDNGRFIFERKILPINAIRMLIEQYAFEQGMDIIRALNNITEWSEEFDLFHVQNSRDVQAKEGFREQIKSQQPGDDPGAIRYVPGMNIEPKISAVPNHYVYRLAVIGGIAFAGVNGIPYAENYQKMAEEMPFKVTILFDDCFGTVSSIPTAEDEEMMIYGHSTIQSKNMRAREAQDAFLSAFSELGEKYKAYKNVV